MSTNKIISIVVGDPLVDNEITNNIVILLKMFDMDIEMQTLAGYDANLSSKVDWVFLDAANFDLDGGVPADISQILLNTNLVLFNATRQVTSASQCVLAGIKGVFYQDDRLELQMKGLASVFNRELWFTRAVINDAIMVLLNNRDNTITQPSTVKLSKKLTKQEVRIINMVCQGSKNNEVANNLNISTHTVNTHINNVYRKTHSHNRIQLMHWALENL